VGFVKQLFGNKKKIKGENVLGYIEGGDLKNELIIITAHYDHLGKHDSLVFNGADDDGSGTVATLEIAEAFMLAKKAGHGPRRSVLIMPVSGEEKGLLGSKYYTDHPVYPLEKTVANLNIDMIGRLDDWHDTANYVYLIGADRLSQELHDISEEINKKHIGLNLDYTFNEEDDPNRYYYRSDHYNFAKNNIPVIFYFNGVHEDYHKTTDTVEKIDFQKIENITRLVFLTAWELANRDERIILSTKKESK
jgi:Zn-dependent M28 family amino/carboxypeptidase